MAAYNMGEQDDKRREAEEESKETAKEQGNDKGYDPNDGGGK